MKRILIVIVLLLGIQAVHAQTWDEWFRQKKTQIRYLLKQIAALKVYTGYLEKGYEIAKDGTRLIGDIKQGDFNLHNGYFASLKSVNPAIKNSSRVNSIICFQARIIQKFKRLRIFCRESGEFTVSELNYIDAVYKNLTTECEKEITELLLVITAGDLAMKDDERIKQIEKIYLDMQGKYTFAQSFCNETSSLALGRTISKGEIEFSKRINGIK